MFCQETMQTGQDLKRFEKEQEIIIISFLELLYDGIYNYTSNTKLYTRLHYCDIYLNKQCLFFSY